MTPEKAKELKLRQAVNIAWNKLNSMRCFSLIDAAKEVRKIVEPLRKYVQPGCHVGKGPDMSDLEKIEWYAGQLLDVVDSEGWFVMNTTLNLYSIVKKN